METTDFNQQTDAMARKYPEWFEIPATIARINIFKSDSNKVVWVQEQLEKQPPMALFYIVDACVRNPYTIELVDRSAKEAIQRLRAELSGSTSAADNFHIGRLIEQYQQVVQFADIRLIAMGQRRPKPAQCDTEQQEIFENWASTQDPTLLEAMMADMIAEQTFPPQKPAK